MGIFQIIFLDKYIASFIVQKMGVYRLSISFKNSSIFLF